MKRFNFYKKHLLKHPSEFPAELQYVDRSLETNEQWAQKTFEYCHDVKMKKLEFEGSVSSVLLVYCNGMCDLKQIDQVIIPSLEKLFSQNNSLETWNISSLQQEKTLENLITRIFNGELVIFFNDLPFAYTINISDPPKRTPEEPNTEISIRGPRDGFIEDISINIALIRKRLPTDSLSYEEFVLGSRSKTKVGLLYMKDIIQPSVLNEIRERLSGIDYDAIYGSTQIEDFLADSHFSLFPALDYTGRPDYVVNSLVKGRFAIFSDGTPTVNVGPVNLSFLLSSPEDYHISFIYVVFERLIRSFGLLLALFLPGFYIAIATYHQDQIPLTLLATLNVSRKGVPFPTPLEAFIMLVLFELFREAGLRLPSSIGQTLAVVGGLIIGDSAIRAGLTSPSMLVVAGTTSVATFTLVNQSLTGIVTVLRIAVLLVSSLFGMFGFLVSVFTIIIYMANIRSFGLPFLVPLSPLYLSDLKRSLLLMPRKKRPEMLKPVDRTRTGGDK